MVSGVQLMQAIGITSRAELLTAARTVGLENINVIQAARKAMAKGAGNVSGELSISGAAFQQLQRQFPGLTGGMPEQYMARLARIAPTSYAPNTRHVLKFGLNRDIRGAGNFNFKFSSIGEDGAVVNRLKGNVQSTGAEVSMQASLLGKEVHSKATLDASMDLCSEQGVSGIKPKVFASNRLTHIGVVPETYGPLTINTAELSVGNKAVQACTAELKRQGISLNGILGG